MSSQMSSFFRYGNTTMNSDHAGSKDTTIQKNSSEGILKQQSLAEIKQLIAGQTIAGEVISVKGNEVEILLDKGGTLIARMDADVNLIAGKIMSFEVKKNGLSQILLRPLFENLEQHPNTLKAIDAASIPQNEKTIALVRDMMAEGLPVDKNSLQNLHKIMLNFPDTNPTNLVFMTKMNLPINQETIQQFEQYKNFEHSVLNSIETSASAFGETVSLQLNQPENAPLETLQKLTDIFTLGADNPVETDRQINTVFLDANTQVNVMVNNVILTASPEGMQPQLPETPLPVLPETILPEALLQETFATEDNISADLKQFANLGFEEILQEIKEGNISPKDAVALTQSGQISPYELFKVTEMIISQNGLAVNDEWSRFVKSSDFRNILQESLMDQWMIKPGDVALEGTIGRLYDRIQSQTSKIADVLSNAADKNSTLMKNITSLSQNVEFMNHLNQVYNYVQLPLKFLNENAHGDLYVYTNKKNLMKKEGEISALLHLDMENLGKVDVYVSMQGEKVSTNFKLEKEESLQLIEDNIHILNDHLESRGYSMQCELMLADKNINVIEELLADEKGIQLLSQYSFDVRA